MLGLGYRTIKSAVGAGLAIFLAELFQLGFSTFAGIIVIMCIEKTKKKSLDTISKKFFASLLSLILGGFYFEIVGYTAWAITIFIILFIPLLMKLKIQGGFVTSMVVFLHIYALENFQMDNFLNELYIILIGIGVAIAVNSFMPNLKKDIDKYKKEIEGKFQTILYEFSAYLRDTERLWDGKEIFEAEDLINEAKSLAIQDVENHLLRKQHKDYSYLEMREDQLVLLERMLPIVSSIGLHLEQKEIFAEFLEYLSQHVYAKNTTEVSMEKLDKCWELIRETDLPTTREEFETRANLFYLMNEIGTYLNIKQKLFAKG